MKLIEVDDLDALVANENQPNQLLTNDGIGNFTVADLACKKISMSPWLLKAQS